MRRVIFLRLPSGVFGNGGQAWLSIDLKPSRDMLEKRGFSILESTVDRAISLDLRPNDIVIYSSSDDPEIYEYMKDAFYFIRNRCQLLPHYDFLMAYENKGFQEIYRKERGFGNLDGNYFYDLDVSPRSFPYVFKTITGAGSSGVHLIRSKRDLRKLRCTIFSVSLRRRLILLQRKWKLSKEHYAAYSYRHKGFRRYAVQEFISGLECDYKILIFGERFFSLKRYVRKGDFRASGSGNFDFTASTPAHVLDFAASIANKLDAPQLSLDIADSGGTCHLIEYQALNFGPTTLTLSKGYYRRESGGWAWVSGVSDLGETYAHSLEAYFDKHDIRATA
ncbi:hypothetical protein [Rhizorhabdus histidinilytica]|uniref:hypothetical protein n=1 Tax=Rhizorhabdus histidinilytica TaxID=439228 RepID=UPI0032201FFA